MALGPPVLPQIRVLIDERSEVGAARRAAVELAKARGLDETQAGKVGLCVTEAATNIVKHAGTGQVLLRVLRQSDDTQGIEILALDKGPGIANVPSSMRDGVSTAGSQGTGLGALSRQSEEFDVYAPPGRGTAVRMVIWSRPPAAEGLQLGAICLPKTGETVSGDAWGCESDRGRYTFLVADGLGHGPDAARASNAAVRVLHQRTHDEPSGLLEACHRALVSTRGAAVSVGRIVPAEQKASFAGVGNVVCRIEQGEMRRQLVSHNGTLGHSMRRVQQFEVPLPPGALVIFHSDGLATHWNVSEYPGLATRHAGIIAGVLYRDHERGRDDVTVLVARETPT